LATSKNDYLSTKPTNGVIEHQDVRIPVGEAGAYFAANKAAEMFKKSIMPYIGRGKAYTAAQWTVTDGGTADAWAEATTAGGGLKITTPTDDDFNMSLQSVQLWTPAAAKYVSCFARIAVDDADKIGFHVGIGNTQVLPFTTDFTDKVMIQKAITSTDIVGAVRGNSGTAANSAALATCTDGGVIDIGFWFKIGTSGSVGTAGAWYYNGKFTSFSGAQLNQLFAILTTPPSVYFTIDCTGVTGTSYNMTVISAACEVDN
jgi:hypothetical protein